MRRYTNLSQRRREKTANRVGEEKTSCRHTEPRRREECMSPHRASKKRRMHVATPSLGEEKTAGHRAATPRLSPKSKSHAQPARGSSTILHIYRQPKNWIEVRFFSFKFQNSTAPLFISLYFYLLGKSNRPAINPSVSQH
jgi:hypothetical protein